MPPPEDLGSQAQVDNRSSERRLLEQQIAIDAHKHGQESFLAAGINAPLSGLLSTDDVKANKTLLDLEAQVKQREAAGDNVGLQALDAQIKDAIAADVKAQDATFNATNCSTFLADVVATVPLFMRGKKGRVLSSALTALNSNHIGDSAGDQFMEMGMGAGRGLGSQMMFESMGEGKFLRSFTNPGIKNGAMGYVNRTFSTATTWDTYKDGFGTAIGRIGGQAVDVPAIIGDIAIGSLAHGASGMVNQKFDNILQRNAALGNMFTASVIGTASGAHGEFTHQLGNVMFNDGTFDVGAVLKSAGVEGFKNALSGYGGAKLDGGHGSMFVPDPDVSPPAPRTGRPPSTRTTSSPTSGPGPIRPESQISMGNDNFRVVSSNTDAVIVEHNTEAHISTGTAGTVLTGTMESNGYVSAGTGKVRVDNVVRDVPLWRKAGTTLEPEVFVDLHRLSTPPGATGEVRVQKVDNLIAASTPEVQRVQQQGHWTAPVSREANLEGVPKPVVGHATERVNRVVVATDAPPPSGTPTTINVSHGDIANYQGVRIYVQDASGTTTTPKTFYANAAGEVFDMALQQDGSYVGTRHPEYRALDAAVTSTVRQPLAGTPGTEVRIGSDHATIVAATNNRVILNQGAGNISDSINTDLSGPHALTGDRMTVNYDPSGTMTAEIDGPGGRTTRTLQLFTSKTNPNEVYVNAADISGTGTPADSSPVRIADLLARPGNEVSALSHVNAPSASWAEPRSHIGEGIRDAAGADLGTIAGHSQDGSAYVVDTGTAPGTAVRVVSHADLQQPRYKPVVVYEEDPTTKAVTPLVMYADSTLGNKVYEMQAHGDGYEAHETQYKLADAALKPYAPEHTVGTRMQVGSREATLQGWDPAHRNAALRFEQTIQATGRAAGERNGAMTANGFVDSQITVPVVLVPGELPAMTRLYQRGGKVYADLSDPTGTNTTGKYNPIELQGVVITPEADLNTAHSGQKRTPQMDMAQQEIGRQIQDGGTGHTVVGHDLEGRNAVVLSGVNGPSVEVSTITPAQLSSDYEPVSVRVNGKASDSPVLYYAPKGLVAPGSPAPIFEMVPDGNGGFKVMSHPELLLRQTQDATGAVEDARDRAEAASDAERRDPSHPDNQARTLLRDATIPGASEAARDAFKDYIRQNASKLDEEYLRTKHPDSASLNLIDEAYAELVSTGRSNLQKVTANPNDLTAQTQFIDWALSVGKDTASRVQLNGDALRPLRERLEQAQNAFDYLYAATTGRDVTTSLPKFNETLTNLLSNTTNKLPGQTDAQAMAANYDMRAVLLKAAEHSMEGPAASRQQAIDYINKVCDDFGTTKGTELLRRAALPADVTAGDGPSRVTDFIIFASKQSPEILAKFERETVTKPKNDAAGETADVDLKRSVSDLVECARNLNGAYDRLLKIARNIGDVQDFNQYIDTHGKYLFSSLNELIRNSPELSQIEKERAIGRPGDTGALQRAYIAKFPQAAELLSNAAAPEGTFGDYRKLLDFVHQNGPDAFLPGANQTAEQTLLNWVLVNRPEYNLPRSTNSPSELVRDSFEQLQYQAIMAGRALRAQATGVSPDPNINLSEPSFGRLATAAAHFFGGAGGTATAADYHALKYDLFDWAAKSNDPYLQQVVSKAFDSNALTVPKEGDPIRGAYLGIMGIAVNGSFAHPGRPGDFQNWASTMIADAHGTPIQAGIAARQAIIEGVRGTLMRDPALEARLRQQLEQTASGQQHEFLTAALQGIDLPSLFTELQNTPVTPQNERLINLLYEAIGKRIDSTTGVSDFQDFLAHRANNAHSGMRNDNWKFIAQTTSPPPAGRVEPRLAQQFLFPGDQPAYVPTSKAGDAEVLRILSELERNPFLAGDIQAPVPNSTAQPLSFRIQQMAGHYLLPNQPTNPGRMYYDPVEIERYGLGKVLRGETGPLGPVTPLSPERAPQTLSHEQRIAALESLFENYKPSPPTSGAAAPPAPAIRDTTLNKIVEMGNVDPSILARISSEAAGYKPANRTAFLELVGQLADSGASIEDMNVILDWTRNARLLLSTPPPPPQGRGRQQPQQQNISPDNLRRGTMYKDMANRVINSLVAPDVHMNQTTAVDARRLAMDEEDREGRSAWSGGVKGKTNPQNVVLATAAFQADVAAAQVLQTSFRNVLN